MTKAILTLALSVSVLAVSACSMWESETLPPPGKYEKTTESTNSYGTTTKSKTMTDVTVDNNGHKSATVKKETSTDPKGLFNKSTTTTTKKYN